MDLEEHKDKGKSGDLKRKAVLSSSPAPECERLYLIVPSMETYVRDLNSYGVVGMAWRTLLRFNISFIRVAPLIAGSALKLLSRDMPAIVRLLSALEITKCRPDAVILHPQLTDLYVANGCRKALEDFSAFVSSRGFRPGFFTNNSTRFLALYPHEGITVTPVNPKGYSMKPGKKEVEEAIRFIRGKGLVAYDPDCSGAIPEQEARDYLKSLNIADAVWKKHEKE